MANVPTYLGKGAFAGGISTVAPSIPTGVKNEDFLLLFVESANENVAAPTGWTEVTNSPQGTGTAAAIGAVRLHVFWKGVGGVETAPTVADAGNHTTAIIAAFRGVNLQNPFNVTAGSTQAATTAMSFPTVTTTVANTLIVLAAAQDTDAASTATMGAVTNGTLTGITEIHDETISSGVGGGLAIAYGNKATAGATGASTATGSTSVTHAYLTMALQAAEPVVRAVGQYRNDRRSAVPVGGATSGDGVADEVFLHTEYDSGVRETATTPKVEVKAVGTSFNGTPTSTAKTIKQSAPDTTRGSRGATLVYDSINKRLLAFGGYDGTTRYNDVWERYTDRPGQPWRKLSPSGTPPSGRNLHAATISRGSSYAAYDQSGLGTGDVDVGTSVGAYAGQSFSVTGNWTPEQLEILLKKTGSATGNVTAKVYAHTGTYGTSSNKTGSAILVASTTLDVSTLTTSYAWKTFSFGSQNGTVLANGTNYTVVIEVTSAISGGNVYLASQGAVQPGNMFNSISGSLAVDMTGFLRGTDWTKQYMVIWGGADPNDKNDMFTLNISTPGSEAWATVTQTSAPTARSYVGNHMVAKKGAISEGQISYIYLYGGWAASRENALYRATLDMSTGASCSWQTVKANAAVGNPPQQTGVVMAYKESTNKLYLYGGYNGTTMYNTFWEFDINGNTWTNTTPSGTAPTGSECMAGGYDATNNRFWFTGGWTTNGTFSTSLNQIGYIDDVGGSEAYVIVRANTLIDQEQTFPGHSFAACTVIPELDFLYLRSMATVDSTERYDYIIDFDDAANYTSEFPVYGVSEGEYFNARDAMATVIDPVSGDWLNIGGFDDMSDDATIVTGTHSGDVWSYDEETNSWRYAVKGHKALPPLEGRIAVYDTTRNRVLLFGGLTGATEVGNEVWTLTRDVYGNYSADPLRPTGTKPSPRWLGAGVYDAANDRMIITMGGNGSSVFNDTWALNFSGSAQGAWTQLTPTGSVTAAAGVGFADKPSNKRLYIFGGASNAALTTVVGNFYYLDYSTTNCAWTTVTQSGQTNRRTPAMAYDSDKNRIMVFGGYNGSNVVNTTSYYNLTTGTTWVNAAPTTIPDARRSAIAAYINGKFYINGGRPNTGMWYRNTWELTPNYGTPNSSSWVNKYPAAFTPTFHVATGLAPTTNYHWQAWTTEGSIDSTKVSFSRTLSESTYYFDGSDAAVTDPNSAWTSDTSLTDGNTATYASNNGALGDGSFTSEYLQTVGTNAPTSGDTIENVQVRIYSNGAINDLETANIRVATSSAFTEILGDAQAHNLGAGVGPYQTLKAPIAGWTWTAVNNLAVRLWATNMAGSGFLGVSKIEVKVITSSVNSESSTDFHTGNPSAPTVTTGAETDVSYATTTGNGNVTDDGGAVITERGFVWKLNSVGGDPTTSDSKVTVAGTTGAFSGSMTGLSASTAYKYRAYAINATGTSYGALETFTTTSGPPTVVTDQAAFGWTNIVASATVTSDGGSTVTERGFVLNTATAPTTANTKITVSGTTGSYTGRSGTLTANTTYYIRAYAINANGTSYGNEYTIRTSSVNLPPLAGLITPVEGGTTGATPTFEITGQDPDADTITYGIDIDTVNTFDSQLTNITSQTAFDQAFIIRTATTIKIGQAVQSASTTPLRRVRFRLNKEGNPTGGLRVSVYATTGTYGSTATGTGTALATSKTYYNTADLPSGSANGAWYDFWFDGEFSMQAGVTYAIVAEIFGSIFDGASDYIVMFGNATGVHAGNALNMAAAGTWNSVPTIDMTFEINGGTRYFYRQSNTDPGFIDTIDSADSDPFTSGNKVSYTLQNSSAAQYYFNGSDGTNNHNSAWTNPANLYNGNLTDYTNRNSATAGSNAANYLHVQGTNAPGSGGSIDLVRVRVYMHALTGPSLPTIEVYTDGLAQTLETVSLPSWSGIGFTPYYSLDAPTGGWTWAKVQDLEVKLWLAAATALDTRVYRIDVEVVSSSTATLSSGTYYWRSIGYDSFGSVFYGEYSPTRSFVVSATPSYTVSHTTSANKKLSGNIVSHTTSANKKKAGNTVFHTTSSNKKVSGITRTHTTDAFKKIRVSPFHTTSANKKKTTTVFHTTSANKKVSGTTRTHTTDAVKRKQFTVAHTTNANLRFTFGTTHIAGSIDGGLADTLVATKYTMPRNGIVTKLTSWVTTSGNQKAAIFADNAGAPGARLVVLNTTTAVTGGQFNDIDIPDIYLPAGTYWLALLDSVGTMRKAIASAPSSNQAAYNTTGNYAAGIPDPFPTPSFQDYDYQVFATYTPITQGTSSHTTDAYLRTGVSTFTRTHTTDALKRKTGLTVAHTTSANKKKATTVSHTTSSNLKKTTTVFHTTSANKKKSGLTVSHTTSANKKKSGNIVSHTTSANKRVANNTVSHTTSANKRVTGNTVAHTTNSFLRKANTVAHTTDALKRKANTLSHTTSSVIRKANTVSHTTSANKKKAANTITHTTNSFLRKAFSVAHTTDANKKKATTVSHTTSSNVKRAYSVSHTTSANKRVAAITRTHTTDALKRARNTVSHTTDANKKKSGNTVSHTTSAYKVFPDVTTTIVDNFNDNSVNTALWDTFASSGTANEQNNRFEMVLSSGASFLDAAYIHTKSGRNFNFVGQSLKWQIVTAPTGTQVIAYGFLTIGITRAVIWQHSNGNLRAIYNTGTDNVLYTVAYSSAVSWVRIRESGGTIYWDTSPDGVTWTQRASQVPAGTLFLDAVESVGFEIDPVGTTTGSQSYFIDNVNIGGQFTRTHTTDALKRKATTVSHTTSANKRVTNNTVSHTTSANKRVAAITRSHTTNSVIRKANTLAHTTSANKRKATTVFHTTSANKRVSGTTVAHTTNSLLRKQFTRTHTTDAFKRTRPVVSHTTDALKRKATTVAHTTNALKRILGTLSHTTSSFKRIRNTVSHTTDARTFKYLFSDIVDNFDDGTLNTAYWEVGTYTQGESGGKAWWSLSNTWDDRVRTYPLRSLIDNQFYFNYEMFLVSSTVGVLGLLNSGGTMVMQIQQNDSGAVSLNNSAFSVVASWSYNPSTTNWVRFRETSGTLYVETSGTSSGWTTQWSGSTPAGLGSAKFEARGGNAGGDLSKGGISGSIDNFNVGVATFTRTHTTDTLKRTANTLTHTTSSVIRKANTVSHTTSANKKKAANTVSHTTNANLKRAYTVAHTTSANRRKATTVFHTTDANKKRAYSVSHTTSANKRVAGNIVSHTTSSVIRKANTLSHTTNALKRKANTVAHTTNSLLRKANIVAHTTSSMLRKQSTVSHTTSSNLKKSGLTVSHTTSANKRKTGNTVSHTTSTVIRKGNIVAHTTNALLRKLFTLSHTTNAFLRKQTALTHTTDSYLRKGNTVSHTTNANKKKANNTVSHTTSANKRTSGVAISHTTNSLLRRQVTVAHTTNALKRALNTLSHTTSTVIRKANTVFHTTSANKRRATTVSHTTNANLKKSGNLVSHTTDVNRRKATIVAHTTNSNLRKATTVSHTTSANKRVSGNTVSHTTSANKRKANNLVTHTTSSVLRKLNTLSHTTNALLRKQSTLAHTTNALKRTQNVLTHTTNSFLRKQNTVAHTTSANKKKANNLLTHTTNALKRTLNTVSHTTSAFRRTEFTRTHTTDSFLRKQNTRSHTTDSYRRAGNQLNHTTDANKKLAGNTVSHTTSANKRIAGRIVSHTTNALLRRQLTLAHTTNALKRSLNVLTHTTSSVIRKANTLSHTTNANKRRATIVSHTTSANLRRAYSVFHTTNANKRVSGNAVSHTTSANKRTANNIVSHTTNALKRTLNVVSHTTNSLLRKANTLAHTTNAMVRKANVVSHATDANKRRAYTVDHTTNANKRKSGNLVTHTTNALKRSANTISHTTNALKRVRNTLAHTTNTFLRRRLELAHTTNALLRKATALAHTTSANKRKATTVSHTTDSNKRKAGTVSHTTNTLLRQAKTLAHTTDSFLRKGLERIHTTDANKKRAGNIVSHTADAFKRGADEVFHNTDANKRRAYTVSHTTNASKKNIRTVSHTTSAFKRRAITIAHTTSSFLRKANVVFHSTDTNKRKSTAISHTTSAFLRGANQAFHTTNANKRLATVVSHSTDALLRQARIILHTTDSFLRTRSIVAHTTNAFLRRATGISHTTSSNLRKANNLVSHTTSSVLRKFGLISHSTDALLKERDTVSHSTNAFLRKATGISHTTNANKRKSGNTRSHTTNAVLSGQVGVGHSTDANLWKQSGTKMVLVNGVWEYGIVKVLDNGVWKTVPVYIWNGTAWVLTSD